MSQLAEITPQELAERLKSVDRPFLLDVRNPYEVAIATIPGTSLVISLDQLPERLTELDKDADMVIYCRSGARSGRAVEFLRYHGFQKAVNLAGGILRWSDDVDPTVQKY
jgi:adenylyltransferase/sulfurtransferase